MFFSHIFLVYLTKYLAISIFKEKHGWFFMFRLVDGWKKENWVTWINANPTLQMVGYSEQTGKSSMEAVLERAGTLKNTTDDWTNHLSITAYRRLPSTNHINEQ